MENKRYKDLNIINEIEKKINTFNKTRDNRLEMSKRLKNYNDKWRLILFSYNILAILIVISSIVSLIYGENGNLLAVFSGVFTLYVILLQYYINELNYNERALKLHYHQLEIEDCILKLKMILLRNNSTEISKNETEILEEYSTIISKYQTILKNNENHSNIDNRKNEVNNSKSLKGIKVGNNKVILRKKKNFFLVKITTLDTSVDNIFIITNWFIFFLLIYSYINLIVGDISI